MTEQRANYQAGPPVPTYRVKLTYHLTYSKDQAVKTDGDELLVEAHSADQAAVIAIAQLERFKPRTATITNLVLQVSLDL